MRLVDHWLAHQTCIWSVLTANNDSSSDNSLVVILSKLWLVHAHVVVVECLKLVVSLHHHSVRAFRFLRP